MFQEIRQLEFGRLRIIRVRRFIGEFFFCYFFFLYSKRGVEWVSETICLRGVQLKSSHGAQDGSPGFTGRQNEWDSKGLTVT